MADDEREEITATTLLAGVSESTNKTQERLRDESSDNLEDVESSSEKSIPKIFDCNEDKTSSHEHVSLNSCSDDEETAIFDSVFENDRDIPSTDCNTSTKEGISDPEIKPKIPQFEQLENNPCKKTVDEFKTDQIDLPTLQASLQSDGLEFRHRHVRERVEDIEEILPSQSGVSFEHGLKGPRETHIPSDTRQHDTETTADKDLRTDIKKLSIFKYFMAEISRGYILELDEDKYADKRRKVYTFMKIPREVEKLMIFGFMLCLDCFIFMFTFLPIRVLVALWKLVSGVFCCKKTRLLEPAQICDLLKASIILVSCSLLEYVDFSVMYHTVRGQSVIKLYVIYNMLEVADRLFSSFGQDILDALFWTATEPRDRRRHHFGTLPHFALGVIYVFLHAVLVLFQATCLNVAVNSHNKALLVILVSNQFVELKGSVFKRFERNNLFQMACSDIRERFHYLILVSVVCLRNLTEFNWNLEHLYVISPYLFAAVSSEYFVDWVKHAFITKFNDIPPEVYIEYRSRLAKDATSSRQKNAHADHFDLVSRRMGFIPLPLGSLIIRVLRHSIHISGIGAVALLVATYIFLMSVKILNSIIFLGKASQYAKEHPTKSQPSCRPSNNPATTTHIGHDRPTGTQDSSEPTKKPERKPSKSLAEIDRYTLCSKEIVLF